VHSLISRLDASRLPAFSCVAMASICAGEQDLSDMRNL